MSAIPGGVPFTGFVAPTDSTDTYAVIDPIYGIDGLRSVADITARNAITSGRRREGMIVYTRSDGKYWKLKASPWANDSTDWYEVLLSGTYSFVQTLPSTTWSISHNLGKYPSTTILDSSGSLVFGDVAYIDTNTLSLSFSIAISGTAYLN
jgi:hypothetical protein